MQNNYITNLLDLKGVIVTKFRNRKNHVRIHIELPIKEHSCPCLCIDEFRGNTGNFKYQVSLIDAKFLPVYSLEIKNY